MRSLNPKEDDHAWTTEKHLMPYFTSCVRDANGTHYQEVWEHQVPCMTDFTLWRSQGIFERFWQAGLLEYASKLELIGNGVRWMVQLSKHRWGEKATGANPTDRRKSGTKRSLLVEGKGIPVAVVVDGGNRHDMKVVEQTLQAQQLVPKDLLEDSVRHLCLDKGYDYDEVRAILCMWGYVGHIPPRDERKRIIKDIPNYRARPSLGS